MKTWKLAIVAIGGCIGTLVYAGNLNSIKPGMWKYEAKTTVSGMPFAMPARTSTYKKCLTQKDTQKLWKSSSENKGEKCTFSNLRKTQHHVSWTMQCSGDANMKGHGQLTLESATAYHGIMDMMMQAGGRAMKTHLEFSGHRVGDCGKGHKVIAG